MLELFLVIVCIAISSSLKLSGCHISTNRDISEPQPLLLNEAGRRILEPTVYPDIITISESTKIKLACTGGYIIANEYKLSEFETAICKSGKFLLENNLLDFSEISCNIYPVNIARYSGKYCEENNKEIDIGFEVEGYFIKQMKLCFDNKIQTTLYSHYTLRPSIKGRQFNFSRPYWIEDDFYDFGKDTVNTLYTQKRQIITINDLLGLDPASSKYIKPSSNYYLARGHLTAKADFVFGVQQLFTFHLVNAAPQWQIFNAGNWFSIEDDVRNYSINRKMVLEVYTGTYGVMTLPNEQTEEDVELYLYNDGENKGLPVPLLYWKAVYNRETKAGVVLIGVNNPYIEDVSVAEICEDISSQISWGTWTKNDVYNGYIYACTVNDFAKKVKYLPKLDVDKILM